MTEAALRSINADPGWTACAHCRNLLYRKRWMRDLYVCPDCGAHARVTAPDRVDQLLDCDGRESIDAGTGLVDPLGFTDVRPYPERLTEARARTRLDEAVMCLRGRIDGRPVVLGVMDFRFLGGSLGAGVGERVTRAAEAALHDRVPLILVTASGGARMQEGALALMQMAKTSQALAQLDDAGVLTVCVVTDPTYGGVAASFASLADVILAEPGARLGFAGPRVIEQTIRRSLPAGFQSAEFLLERGLIDAVVPRDQLAATLGRLIDTAGHGRGLPGGVGWLAATSADNKLPPVVRDPGALAPSDPWQTVQWARHPERPTTLDYLRYLSDSFVELRGDRTGQDCPAVVGGLCRLDGRPVMVIGNQKGHNTRELVSRNFGMPSPAGYRKAARLMRLAEKLGLPVVTLIDTPGADPGPEAEEQGQSVAIAENLRLMARLAVPVIAVVTGEGGSGGALALGVADRVYLLEHAIYSVISPEGCAAILWQRPNEAAKAAAALRLTARELLDLRVADGVIIEPKGGAHADHLQAAEALRLTIGEELGQLERLRPEELVRQRRQRYRRFGTPA
ncbi:acetyl-CoA carboxylase carboxyl transferase subunit [Salinispora oceanensis]|uniref:acetyl-CoA carboxylase carboxyl transferase subunit n=1 Tax=Salinispora oceanensis TaxID=1050199 RepID=UPI00036EA377|nr:acetyl-CoA carboxylase carboxyl transferase subunit [Salinispora oceanensis]